MRRSWGSLTIVLTLTPRQLGKCCYWTLQAWQMILKEAKELRASACKGAQYPTLR
jgi:hypothetical protein